MLDQKAENGKKGVILVIRRQNYWSIGGSHAIIKLLMVVIVTKKTPKGYLVRINLHCELKITKRK